MVLAAQDQFPFMFAGNLMMDVCMDACMDVCMDVCMDACTDAWMHPNIVKTCPNIVKAESKHGPNIDRPMLWRVFMP